MLGNLPSIRPSVHPRVHRLVGAANGLQPTVGVRVDSARDASAGRLSIGRPPTDGNRIISNAMREFVNRDISLVDRISS